MAKREPTETECYHCREVKLCEWRPDPYAAEINDEYINKWRCEDCVYERAMDI